MSDNIQNSEKTAEQGGQVNVFVSDDDMVTLQGCEKKCKMSVDDYKNFNCLCAYSESLTNSCTDIPYNKS